MIFKPNWKKGDLIRHILTGKPMLVVHIYSIGDNMSVTLVIDLENGKNPCPLFSILQRDYDSWVRDIDMKLREVEEDIEFTYNHVDV